MTFKTTRVCTSLYQQRRGREESDRESINDGVVFEAELVKQIDVDIDYILELVKKYHDSRKKDLIDSFIKSLSSGEDVQSDWKTYIAQKKQEEFDCIVAEEHLKVGAAFRVQICAKQRLRADEEPCCRPIQPVLRPVCRNVTVRIP